MDATIHGLNDRHGLANSGRFIQTYKLLENNLNPDESILHASKAVSERSIVIEAPLNGSEVSGTCSTHRAACPIAPFENNLRFRVSLIWLATNYCQRGVHGFQSADVGGPSVFDNDGYTAGYPHCAAWVRLELAELSMADGSVVDSECHRWSKSNDALKTQLERSMLIKRITLGSLIFTLLGSIFALCVLGFKIPWAIPLTPILTFSSFIFSILHSSQIEGWIKTLFFVVLVVAAGLFFESLGVATGLVYGPYHYTDQLGPKFLGLVPYLIPVAWTFMMYPSMVIAKAVTPTRWSIFQRGLTIAALSGVIMTAWDVVMDPMMVAWWKLGVGS